MYATKQPLAHVTQGGKNDAHVTFTVTAGPGGSAPRSAPRFFVTCGPHVPRGGKYGAHVTAGGAGVAGVKARPRPHVSGSLDLSDQVSHSRGFKNQMSHSRAWRSVQGDGEQG